MTFRFPSLAQETARLGYTKAQMMWDGSAGAAGGAEVAYSDLPTSVKLTIVALIVGTLLARFAGALIVLLREWRKR